MPLPLATFFTGGLFAKVISFVIATTFVRIAAAIGLSIVTFTGIDLLFDEIQNFVNTNLAGVSAFAINILELFGFMFLIEIILATAAGVLAIKSLTSFKRLVIR